MTIYNWPNVRPITSSTRLISNTKTFRSPLTGATQTQVRGGSAWVTTADFQHLTTSERGQVQSILARMDGQAHRLRVWDFAYTMQGAEGGKGLVAGASQTGFTIATDNWTASTHLFKPGDLISIEDRMYMITQDAVSDSGQLCTLNVTPRIRVSPGNNKLVFYQHGSDLGDDVTNGNFLTATTGWTAQTATIAAAGGKARVTYSSSATGGIYQAVTVTALRPYRARFELVAKSGTFDLNFGIGTSTDPTSVFESSTALATGVHELEFSSTGTTVYFHVYTSSFSSAEYFDFTGASIPKGPHYPSAKYMLATSDTGWSNISKDLSSFTLQAFEDVL